MSDGRHDFELRRNQLIQRHMALGRGYVATLRPDGLLVREPRRIRFQLPVRGFVLLMVFLMLFKGTMLGALGAAAHHQRIGILDDGTLYEMAAALVMRIDPVSQAIGEMIAGLR